MPIELSTPICAISQDEFHAIDKLMLGQAFAIHNEFGRLLDESIYTAELANRCLKYGIDAQREVLIRVRHQNFSKDYFVDLLLSGSTIIETKAANSLTEAHQGQGINYLLLAGTNHGSLVNFRSPRVRREFLSTRLSHARRVQFETMNGDWPEGDDHARLREIAMAFCADVGVGLDLQLYREAFASLMGLGHKQPLPVLSGASQIGFHEMHLLNRDVGMTVTALSDTADYRLHLQRLLVITPLEGLAWINLRLGQVECIHLRRQNHSG